MAETGYAVLILDFWKYAVPTFIILLICTIFDCSFADNINALQLEFMKADMDAALDEQETNEQNRNKINDILSDMLSMDKAILLAIENRYELANARQSIKRAKAQLGVAHSARYPKLDISASNQYEKIIDEYEPVEYLYEFMGTSYKITPTRNVPEYQSKVALSVSLPVYSGGSITSQIKSAEELIDKQKQVEIKQERDILQSVATAWLDLRKAQRYVKIARENLEQSKVIYRTANERYRIKSVARIERDRADTKRIQAKIELNHAETERLIAIDTLLYEMGIREENKENITVENEKGRIKESIYKTLAEMVEFALQNRPEIQIAIHNINIKNADLRTVSSEWYPDIDLNGRYLWMGYDSESLAGAWDDLDKNKWYAMIEFSFNLFEGFKTQRQVNAARMSSIIAKRELQGVKHKIVLDVKTAWYKYIGSKDKLSLCKTNLELETINMRAVMKEYELGAAAVDRVSEYYDNIAYAKKQYVQALGDLDKAIIKLKWATGESLP